MRILIAGKYTHTGKRPIGGLQSWIKTVAAECERLGHEVTTWEPGQRLVGFHDFGVFANLKHTRPALNFVRQSVLVSHGIIADEQPQPGCDVTAFVSEGVRDHWGGSGPIIRQPIDLDFWRTGGERTHLTRYSYRTAPIQVATGWPYRHVHGLTHEQAREALQTSVCVYATGRAALEAMACGAPTVIYDHRAAYQGPLMGPQSLTANMRNSYSGRGGKQPSQIGVQKRTEWAMQQTGWRNWVAEHHDSRRVTEGLLCLVS